jgi:hypothetical protein
MITRRGFLVGAGGLLTTALFNRFERHLDRTGRPLILAPKRSDETLYVYPEMEYQITLGPQIFKLPKKTWREFLIWNGEGVPQTKAQFKRLYDERGLMPEQLNEEVDFDAWAPAWASTEGPNVKAFHLLDRLDLGPELKGTKEERGCLEFQRLAMIGSEYDGVHCKDELAISLLQARLRELEMPIEVKVAELP